MDFFHAPVTAFFTIYRLFILFFARVKRGVLSVSLSELHACSMQVGFFQENDLWFALRSTGSIVVTCGCACALRGARVFTLPRSEKNTEPERAYYAAEDVSHAFQSLEFTAWHPPARRKRGCGRPGGVGTARARRGGSRASVGSWHAPRARRAAVRRAVYSRSCPRRSPPCK